MVIPSQDILDLLRKNQGGTFERKITDTGDIYLSPTTTIHTDGFYVAIESIADAFELEDFGDFVTPEHIVRYPQMYFYGFWRDPDYEHSAWCADVVIHVPHNQEGLAFNVAVLHGQKAVWDIKNQKTIYVSP